MIDDETMKVIANKIAVINGTVDSRVDGANVFEVWWDGNKRTLQRYRVYVHHNLNVYPTLGYTVKLDGVEYAVIPEGK